jgi:hypothetical protein
MAHDVSGVVAGVLGVVHAFGEFGPALVRHGGEPHENGGALDDVRAGFAEEGERTPRSAAASIGPWEIPWADGTSVRAAPPLRKGTCPSAADKGKKRTHALPFSV